MEGFWSYAKERLLNFQGVSRKNFVYYLKELEFKYNTSIIYGDDQDDVVYVCLG